MGDPLLPLLPKCWVCGRLVKFDKDFMYYKETSCHVSCFKRNANKMRKKNIRFSSKRPWYPKPKAAEEKNPKLRVSAKK